MGKQKERRNKGQSNPVGGYFKTHYQWIIGTLVAIIAILVGIIIVPWGVNLNQKAEDARESQRLKTTAAYYYLPHSKVKLAEVKDNAKCWESIASTRSDAYRCILDNLIYDPCFYAADWGIVDCPQNPKDHQVLTVPKLDGNKANSKKKLPQVPWYVVLEDGTKCNFYTGLTEVVVDGRVDYGCSNKRWLSLPIDNKNEVLTIKCYTPNYNRLEICKIREAWY